jgi:predicted  nucleic acid-binding Zn-ribbon protein|tara:strand:- start:49 stop:270 length:222 start_codon:yes stop_codon:yes gene_type:complete
MMNDKDCKDLEKTLNSLERGPNDLEQQIERLKFRNEVLHKANQKQQDEILDLRTKIKKLEHDAVDQFRNKGEL